ncbi:hypothetical protein BsWGS_22330 [Bradybaena similaris]
MQGHAGVPYLGSKISLISKAEIRYEGTLYTIDPKEATVALAKVRSFGTEDRPTDRPLPARSEIFEFIIFRGHDIKDLHVCEPPPPQPTEGVPLDPAIVKSSQPPPGPAGAAYTDGSSRYPSRQLYQPFVQPGTVYFGQQQQPPPPSAVPGFSMQPSQDQVHRHSSTSESSPRMGQSTEHLNQTPVMPAFGTGSVADSVTSTPPLSRKSPTSDHGLQVRSDSPEYVSYGRQYNNKQSYQRHHQQQYQHHQDQGGRRGGGFSQNNNFGNHQDRGERVRPPSYSRERTSNRAPMRGRDRGRGGPSQNRGRRGYKSSGPLKFDTEFDFETSNAQFAKDAVELELKNLSLTDKSVNGDRGDEDPEVDDDEGGEVVEDDPVYYDKTKSFFDNISCEGTERSKGQRHSWKEERKLNSETFGVSQNFRRNYRGRGNWRGGNMYGGRPGGRGRGGGAGRGGYRDGDGHSRGKVGYNRGGGGFNREDDGYHRDRGGYNREGGGYSRDAGNYNRDGGSYSRDGGSYNREGSGYSNRDGGRYHGAKN